MKVMEFTFIAGSFQNNIRLLKTCYYLDGYTYLKEGVLMGYKIYARKESISYKQFYSSYRFLSESCVQHVILESGRGGRYSIAAFEPEVILKGKDHQLEIVTGEKKEIIKGNPLHSMKQWLEAYKVEPIRELPDFQGGAIGYISYEYGRYIEKLPALSEDDLHLPDIHFLIHNEWFVYDHQEEVMWMLLLYKEEEADKLPEREALWLKRWRGSAEVHEEPKHHDPPEQRLEVSMSEEEFIKAVERIQEYIAAGDVFQVNLSVRQSKPLNVKAIEVYDQLRVLNPSPYMGYFQTDEYELVSGSPELLVKKKGSTVSTRPIAGTRSRGKDELEDIRLANELIENEKERAEHVMLVDLERNDLGRVCEYGTVEVDEFMVIEKYSHVMHIVSNVKGKIAEGKHGVDLIDAAFPGGTITGAPKVRTMEIIEELEPVRRGVYTGSLGWMNFSGDLELNIIIRTMLIKDDMAHVQAGAGIVIDSNPKNEYKESMKKAIALWKAKEAAEEAKGALQ